MVNPRVRFGFDHAADCLVGHRSVSLVRLGIGNSALEAVLPTRVLLGFELLFQCCARSLAGLRLGFPGPGWLVALGILGFPTIQSKRMRCEGYAAGD